MSPSTTTELTARDLFGSDPNAMRTALEEVFDQTDNSLPADTTGPAAVFVVTQAANAIDELLVGMELGPLLMAAWNKLEELHAVIEETRRHGDSQNLTLAKHTVTSEHEPTLELVINQAPRKLLALAITMGFTIDACDLVVTAGEVARAEVGAVRAHGEVKAGGRSILSKESADLDPKRLFHW